jgi:hypothetical protein
MTEQLLISVMLVTPLVGWLLAVAMPTQRNTTIAIATGLAGVASGVWILCAIADLIEPTVSVSVGQWLVVASEVDLAVNLSFRADQSRCILILAASLVLLLKNAGTVSSSSKDVEPGRTALLYALSAAAILSADFVVLAGIWILIDCCVIGMLADRRQPIVRTRKPLNTVLVLGVSGAILLIAILMAMARFNTSDIEAVVSRAVEDGRVDATAVTSGMSVLLVAAVAIRCAFFPALIWARTFLTRQFRDAGIVVALAGILPGFALALAVFPLGTVAADAFRLLGLLGILTSLTATGIAMVQSDSNRIGVLLSVSAVGLAASGLVAVLPSYGPIAAGTLLTQLVAICVLQRDHVVCGRGIALGVALIIATTGVGGSNAVLSVIESSRYAGANEAITSSTGQLLLTAWWGILIGQLLWGIAIVKLLTSRAQSAATCEQDALGRHSVKSSTIASVVATIVALCVCIMPLSIPDAATGSPARLLIFGAATPACLLGMVAAWLLMQAGENVRRPVTAGIDSMTRLSREWFYLEDAIRCGLELPIRGLALVIEICDRVVLGGTAEHGWEKLPVRIAGSIEHLRFQPAVYYGLTGVLLVVGLLWSLR